MLYYFLHVKAAEIEMTFLRYSFAVIYVVAVNRADFCNACHDARSVGITQASFNIETIEIIGIYLIAFVKFFNQRLCSLICKGIDIRIHSFTTNIFSDYYTILCIIKSRIEKQINC